MVFEGGKEVGYENGGKTESPLSGFACTIASVHYARLPGPGRGGSVRWRDIITGTNLMDFFTRNDAHYNLNFT